ncbi:MAG: hypothetical protein H7Z37_08300 [Pyrinomonadaceae bacterium]|nr:hypothetical protein [Pyrinomonadaceae bacterium]
MFAFLGYLLIPTRLFNFDYLCGNYRAGDCIDPSWMLGANLARVQNFVFGRDWVFTFGSLAFLSTRNDVGVSKFYLIAFDILVIANFCFIFRRFVKISWIFGFIASFATAMIVANYRDTIFILTAFLIFWLCVGVIEKSDWAFFAASLITILLFFIKVNASFVALVIYGVCLVYAISSSHKKLVKMYLAVFVPLAIFAICLLTNVAIFDYVRTSLSLIDNYNDAMQLSIYSTNYDYIAAFSMFFVAAFLAFPYLANIRSKGFGFAEIINHKPVIIFVYLLVSFVLFKQSFVRSDGHILAFFSMFPLVILIISAIYSPRFFKFFVLVGLLLFYWETVLINREQMPISGLSRAAYLESVFRNQDDERERYYKILEESNVRKIPAEILAEIGADDSVDIIPYDISLLYFNKLRYNPRPIVQSYSVFNDYLIKLNGRKYASETAPDFVIFSNETIDKRYAFFDDQAAKIALIERYSCVKKFNIDTGKFALLKKGGFSPVNFLESKSVNSRFNQEFVLPDVSKIYRVKFKTTYTVWGRIVRTFYKPNEIGIEFTLESGETGVFRVTPQILESGVLINPFIGSESDFCELVAGNLSELKNRIKHFKLISFDAENGLNENIEIEFQEVIISKKQ